MMGTDTNDNVDISTFKRKDIYTAEEKKFIMDRLDEERRINQKVEEDLHTKMKNLDEDDKKKILETLNEKRLSIQKREEIKKARVYKKQIYRFGSKEFYKFKQMEREYYIEIDVMNTLSSRAIILPLFYRSFEKLKKKEVLIKTEVYSKKIFISYNPVRVYFKEYALEDEYK